MLDRCSIVAINDEKFRSAPRDRTVPIPESITPIPGYPKKLVVFKMAASKYWQVRCWIKGKTHRRSTKSQSLRVAQSVAREFYEQLILQTEPTKQRSTTGVVFRDTDHCNLTQQADEKTKGQDQHSFAVLAAQMFAAEKARVDRGEYSRGSLLILRNRLDSHLLPRWGKLNIAAVGYKEIMDFIDHMSKGNSTSTIGQYIVATRKVMHQAIRVGALNKLPEFPKIKIKTASRGAFTPTEYWRIIRTARKLRGRPHPDVKRTLRKTYKLIYSHNRMPPDMAWIVGFMVNAFIRPSDLKTLKHRHVEIIKGKNTYLRLTLPETKNHDAPIVTLYPAVRIYKEIVKYQKPLGRANPDDYLFLPDIQNRSYALAVLSLMFNWVLTETGLKKNPNGKPRSMYSLRHSAITFRLLYGQGIDLLTLARNARTSVEVINKYYASTVSGEQNISLLQSRRSRSTITS